MPSLSDVAKQIRSAVEENGIESENRGNLVSDVINSIKEKAEENGIELESSRSATKLPEVGFSPSSYSLQQEDVNPIGIDGDLVFKGAKESMARDNPNPKDVIDEIDGSSTVLSPKYEAEQSLMEPMKQFRNEHALEWMQDEIEKDEEFGNELSNYLNEAAWLQSGYDYHQDPMYQQSKESLENAGASGFTRDFQRRLTDADGNIKSNPLDMNLLGFTSQQKTRPGAKAAYQAYQEMYPSDGNLVDRGVVDANLIDDGHNPNAREAMYMTGEEYARQRRFGLPGRDIDDIIDSPDVFYSKQDEQDEYGYIPYLVGESAVDYFHDQASANKVANLFSDLANARRELTDWEVEYDGETYSGKDMIDALGKFNRKYAEQVNDESRYVFDPGQADEYSIPWTTVYRVLDSDTGEVVEFRGEPVKTRNVDEDGNEFIRFDWGFDEQGNPLYADFVDEDDLVNSVETDENGGVPYEVANDGDQIVMWQNVDPLELSDGRKIRADKVQTDLQPNLGEYSKYDDLGFNNPNVIHPTDGVVPWFTDLALGSVPLFFRPTAATQAIGDAYVSNLGMKPGKDYLNGTYSMLSEKPTEEQRSAATIGSAILPITERLYGNLGGKLLTKVPGGVGRFFSNLEKSSPGKRYVAGTVGEGAEEIPGNIVEELMQGYGPSEWYADAVLDENGNPIIDSQGHELRDARTSWLQRFRNFMGDAPESVIGGMALGGILGAPRIPQYVSEWNEAKRNPKKEPAIPYSENVVVPLSDEEFDYYNNR